MKSRLGLLVFIWNTTRKTSLPLLMEIFFFQYPLTQIFSLLVNKWHANNFEDTVALEAYLLFIHLNFTLSLFSQNIISFKIMCHLPISTILIQKWTNNYSLTNWRRRKNRKVTYVSAKEVIILKVNPS